MHFLQSSRLERGLHDNMKYRTPLQLIVEFCHETIETDHRYASATRSPGRVADDRHLSIVLWIQADCYANLVVVRSLCLFTWHSTKRVAIKELRNSTGWQLRGLLHVEPGHPLDPERRWRCGRHQLQSLRPQSR